MYETALNLALTLAKPIKNSANNNPYYVTATKTTTAPTLLEIDTWISQIMPIQKKSST